MCVARGEPDAALRAFRTTWVFMTAVSFAVAALLVVGTMAAPLALWFGFSGLDDGDASIILALFLLQVLVHMQAELAVAGLYGAGHYGLHAFLATSVRLVAFAMVALVLVLGGGPVAAAMAMAGAECAGLAVMVVAARRHGPLVLALALKWATAFVGQGFGALAGAALRPPTDILRLLRIPSP